MKKAIIALSVLTSLNTFATSFNCYGKKGVIEITLNARVSELDGEAKKGFIDRYDVLILGHLDREVAGIQFQGHTSISDRRVTNVPYRGRKYKGYLKFDLYDYDSTTLTINGGVESIEFIVSPNYKVIGTESVSNHWNPNWMWDIETREFDAVFPLNLDDHHGDYIPAKCYTTAKVNEVRP